MRSRLDGEINLRQDMALRLFWKFFLIYAALQLTTVIAFVMLVSNWQEREAFLQKRLRLRDAATILQRTVAPEFLDDSPDLRQTHVDLMGKQTNMRITLVNLDGKVLADSKEDAATMGNHHDRDELIRALETGTGSSQRFSPTLQVSMLYHAARVDVDGVPVGLVRVAIPLSEVEAEVSLIERMLWLVALGLSLSGLFLTYVVVDRAIDPVRTLTHAANAMAQGEYRERVQVPSRDEIGTLAQSFNRMGGEVEARENQLREVVDRMSAVLGGMIEGVFAVDEERRLLFANEAAGRLLNIKPDSVQGRKLSKVIHDKRLRQVAYDTLDSSHDNIVRQIEIKKGSSEIVLAVNGARLPGHPCPGIVVVLHDVTALRRLERLRQEFVANVSHELKTPLSAIIAYAETLRRGAFSDESHSDRFLQQIEAQANRLAELIQDMLQLARIEAGSAELDCNSVQLGKFVDDCLLGHESAANAKNITLSAHSDDYDLVLQTNEEALLQIVDNLVTNAIKYTPESGRVDVHWTTGEDHVLLEVTDNGIGIPEEHHSRIFERFYRVDKARSRELGGTGLGLSIVKHLAQTMGGTVSLSSKPGKGSTFQVLLPFTQSTELTMSSVG